MKDEKEAHLLDRLGLHDPEHRLGRALWSLAQLVILWSLVLLDKFGFGFHQGHVAVMTTTLLLMILCLARGRALGVAIFILVCDWAAQLSTWPSLVWHCSLLALVLVSFKTLRHLSVGAIALKILLPAMVVDQFIWAAGNGVNLKGAPYTPQLFFNIVVSCAFAPIIFRMMTTVMLRDSFLFPEPRDYKKV